MIPTSTRGAKAYESGDSVTHESRWDGDQLHYCILAHELLRAERQNVPYSMGNAAGAHANSSERGLKLETPVIK